MLALLAIILATHLALASGTVEESCSIWNRVCSTIGNSSSSSKQQCVGNNIFYHHQESMTWENARFHCQAKFYNLPTSDLLFLTTQQDVDDFRVFTSSFARNQEIATSALCCVQNTELASWKCVWPTGEDVQPISSDPSVLANLKQEPHNELECSFLTLTLPTGTEPKFMQ